MLNRMGINVNLSEAAVIVQSAKSKVGETEQIKDSLNPEQFLQLIFNEDDNISSANNLGQKGESRVRSMTFDGNSQNNNKNSLVKEVD